jgi:hypothetical protein
MSGHKKGGALRAPALIIRRAGLAVPSRRRPRPVVRHSEPTATHVAAPRCPHGRPRVGARHARRPVWIGI